jgi:hypothetical protein
MEIMVPAVIGFETTSCISKGRAMNSRLDSGSHFGKDPQDWKVNQKDSIRQAPFVAPCNDPAKKSRLIIDKSKSVSTKIKMIQIHKLG